MPSKPIPAKTYFQLVKSIQTSIASAKEQIQKTQAQTYWNIGKFISDYILSGVDRAKYGERIFENLSRDLKIDKRTLEKAVNFAREFPIADARPQLSWTHFRELLSLPDSTERERLVKKAAAQKLTSRQLKEEIKRGKLLNIPSDGPISKLRYSRGELYTYSIIQPPAIQSVDGYKFVDCGFNIWRKVPLIQLAKFDNETIVESVKNENGYSIRSSECTPKDLYVFKATIERIIDGDTILVHVDCGFDTWVRQRLRFRGINCPELSTKEGQAVKRFIEARFKPNDFVIIKTYKDDKYGRYLVDVFYLPGEVDIFKVAREGIYLNQELLDNRLAVAVK